MTTIDKTSTDYIACLLLTNDAAVERAMLVLYERQTLDERATGATRHRNGMGFSGADAGLGSYYARWIKSGRRLTGHHLEKARVMARKYVGQLSEVAKEKARMAEEIRLAAACAEETALLAASPVVEFGAESESHPPTLRSPR